MELVILLAIIGLIGIFLSSMVGPVKKKECKGHKWTYMEEGTENQYMMCKVCRYLPHSGMYKQ